MIINFHIDQINEMMKYLDEVPHKYARGLIEYIQAHVNKTVAEKQQSDVAEIQQNNVAEKQHNEDTTETN
jgi:hypothetical protein